MDREWEWGYREPGIGDAGEKVEVGGSGTGWHTRRLAAVLPEDMLYRFVCRSSEDPKDSQSWRNARIRYRLPYHERQAKCGIGVGDYVKVLRVPENHEDGWGDDAVSSMSASVGKVFEVDRVLERSGFRLKDGHWYPYFVLERVEKPVLEESKSKVRRVADLADGEVICTKDGRWLRVLPKGVKGDVGSDLRNKLEYGWLDWQVCHESCRPARLLEAPKPELSSIKKIVFPVGLPEELYVIEWVFAGAGEWRAVVAIDGDYRVYCLKDLRVIGDMRDKEEAEAEA